MWRTRASGRGWSASAGTSLAVASSCFRFADAIHASTLVECSQEQWDIYKLDPEYDCIVHPAPQLTTITRRRPPVTSESTEPSIAETNQHKRHVEEHGREGSPTKKKRPVAVVTEVEDDDDDSGSDTDEEAVEDMIIDDAMPGAWREKRRKARDLHEQMHENREKRRQKNTEKQRNLRDIVDLSMIDLTIEDQPAQDSNTDSTASQATTDYSQASTTNSTAYTSSTGYSTVSSQPTYSLPSSIEPTTHFTKRTARVDDDDDDADGRPAVFKRARTGSPRAFSKKEDITQAFSKKEDITRKRQELKKRRVMRNVGMSNERREARDRAFYESLRAAAQASMDAKKFSQPESQHGGEYRLRAFTRVSSANPSRAQGTHRVTMCRIHNHSLSLVRGRSRSCNLRPSPRILRMIL